VQLRFDVAANSFFSVLVFNDHLYVIVAPTKEREAKLGNFSAALKRWMRQELKSSWK